MIFILVLLFTISVFILLKYRLTYAKIIRGSAEMRYKMIDLEKNNHFRSVLELIFQNKKVFLKEQSRHIPWLYVRMKDFGKLYPERPMVMKKKKYTVVFEFETRPLLLGGYSVAKIISCRQIQKSPIIEKS